MVKSWRMVLSIASKEEGRDDTHLDMTLQEKGESNLT